MSTTGPKLFPACRPLHRLLFVTCALAAGGCSPAAETPAEPAPAPQATQLRDAVRAPLDKASGTQQVLDDAAARQREAIEAAGG